MKGVHGGTTTTGGGIRIGRRLFLAAGGSLLPIPRLASLAAQAESVSPLAAPSRFMFIYTPNGYNQQTFLPEGAGSDWILPAALQPLAEVRDHVTFLNGLDRTFVPGTGVHAQAGSCWMTSSPPQETLDGGFPTNTTLDQLIARQVGKHTMLPSLELSCNDFGNNKETRYFESISWYGPGHAAATEIDPARVFRRLFGGGDAGKKSLLDAVQGSSRRLARALDGGDRRTLEEYLESLRETERRITVAQEVAERIGSPPLSEPAGIPERRSDYLRLMADLAVHAIRLDLTRVVTLLVDPERWDTPRVFDGIGDKPLNHHGLTHTKGDEAKALITEIDRFHVDFFATVTKRLASVPDGSGSLLDSTTLLMGSGISDGNSHDYSNLQVLLSGGPWNRGHFHFDGRRPLADLWLSVARSAGVELPRFADSTGLLKEVHRVS